MRITEGWLNVIRCGLYFVIALLTPIVAVVNSAANGDATINGIVIGAAALTGLLQGALAVRAYLDGSNERWQQKRGGNQPEGKA